MAKSTSPTQDPAFMELVRLLEECEARHGLCESCLNWKNCRQLFDRLAEIVSDKPMTHGRLIEFRQRLEMLVNQEDIFTFK
jgi:hypothetical protein